MWSLLFLLLALICFGIAAIGFAIGRPNLVALGLGFLTAAFIAQRVD